MNFFIENKDNIDIIISILQAISTLLVPIILVFISSLLNRRTKVEESFFEHKRKIFEDFLDILLDIMNINGTGGKSDEGELKNKMLNFKKKLLLYASESTLYHFSEYILFGSEKKKSSKKSFLALDKFLYFLRKDLGLEDKSYKWYKINRKERIQIMLKEKIK